MNLGLLSLLWSPRLTIRALYAKLISVEIPADEMEAQRWEALRHYGDIGEPYDPGLQELVAYASELIGVPISLVSLVERDRQRFRAEVGMGRSETPIEESFCAHSMLQPGVFEVRDAAQDARFRTNPLVTGEAGVRFYAEVGIADLNGFPLGAFCVVDVRPRELTDFQRRSLQMLGRQAEVRLNLLRSLRELKAERGERVRAAAEREALLGAVQAEKTRLRALLDRSPAFASFLCGEDLTYEYVNAAHGTILGTRDVLGKPLLEALPEVEGQAVYEILKDVMRTGETCEVREFAVRLWTDRGAETRYVDAVFQAFREADGTISGVFSHGVDVTRHVAARRERVERFRRPWGRRSTN